MDTNKDGVVTKDEAAQMQMPASVFDTLDANKDGKLVLEEVKDLPTPSGPPPQR